MLTLPVDTCVVLVPNPSLFRRYRLDRAEPPKYVYPVCELLPVTVRFPPYTPIPPNPLIGPFITTLPVRTDMFCVLAMTPAPIVSVPDAAVPRVAPAEGALLAVMVPVILQLLASVTCIKPFPASPIVAGDIRIGFAIVIPPASSNWLAVPVRVHVPPTPKALLLEIDK